MPTRRDILGGALAAIAAPCHGWAAAGDPAFLAAARDATGRFHLCGLCAAGDLIFRVPLPDRGHAAAAHPLRPEAVAFARRPGTFALIINCATGALRARLTAPSARHFYGHGAFTPDGALLLTTENDTDTLEGRIGLWDAARGYARIGDLPSGGIGPHEIVALPGGGFAVGNGGIATHPDSGRQKLNLPTMRPNLTYLDASGGIVDKIELASEMRLASIRHLAAAGDLVAAGLQWQGNAGEHPPLLMLHRRAHTLSLVKAPEALHQQMRGYAGSVAISGEGCTVGITSPRGGILHLFDAANEAFSATLTAPDICGLAPAATGLAYTTGLGLVGATSGGYPPYRHAGIAFDNHLVAIG